MRPLRGNANEILTRAGIVQGVDPEAVSALMEQLRPVEFPRGFTVYAEGAPGDRLFIIISGKIKIGRRSTDGRENLLTILGPSDMFGTRIPEQRIRSRPRRSRHETDSDDPAGWA